MKADFSIENRLAVAVRFAGETVVARSPRDLKPLLDHHADLEEATLERLGIAACLLVADELLRAGGDLTWDRMQKALDPYYLVVPDRTANDTFERGLDGAMSRIRDLRGSGSDRDVREELAQMLT